MPASVASTLHCSERSRLARHRAGEPVSAARAAGAARPCCCWPARRQRCCRRSRTCSCRSASAISSSACCWSWRGGCPGRASGASRCSTRPSMSLAIALILYACGGVVERPRHPAGAAGGRHGGARRQPRRIPDRRHRRARACSSSRSSPISPAMRSVADYTNAGVLGVRAVHRRAVRVADRQPPARERSAGAPAGSRPREPRAAVAVHRAAPAREHPGRRHRRIASASSTSPRRRCWATAAPTPAPCWARPRRACCTCWRPGARTTGAPAGRAATPSSRPTARASSGRISHRSAAANPAPVLVFLEDTSLIAEQVQQSKLAALGRLSASIAHEIRNPVGAMSHAGQLLAESAAALARRTSASRRSSAATRTASAPSSTTCCSCPGASETRLERLSLADWLEEFCEEFCETMQLAAERACASRRPRRTSRCASTRRSCTRSSGTCATTPCGTRSTDGGARTIEIRCGRLNPGARPFLEVADRGPGRRPRARRAHLRAVLQRRPRRHGPRTVPGARAGADQRRDAAVRAARRRRQHVPAGVRRSDALGVTMSTYRFRSA